MVERVDLNALRHRPTLERFKEPLKNSALVPGCEPARIFAEAEPGV